MDVPALMAAMAARIATVPGVASAYHTPPNTLQAADLPAVVLFWHDTVILPDSDGQLWLPVIRAQVLVSRDGDTPQEYASVWELITPIVDAFPVGPTDTYLDGLDGHVDHILVSRDRPIRPSLLIGYARHMYFGAEIYFDAKFHRYEDVP